MFELKFQSEYLNVTVFQSMIFIEILFFIATAYSKLTTLSDKIRTGKLVVVYDSVCIKNCKIIVDAIRKLYPNDPVNKDDEPMYYLVDHATDESAREYMVKIKYGGSYPIYFFKTLMNAHPEKGDGKLLDILGIDRALLVHI